MGLVKLLSGRSQVSDDLVVSDLDKLIAEPVAFRFMGEKHFVKPLDTKTFLAVSEGFAKLDQLRLKDEVSIKDLMDGYTDLFQRACDTITKRHVEKMSPAQIGALMQLIVDTVKGQSQLKKKLEQASPPQPKIGN